MKKTHIVWIYTDLFVILQAMFEKEIEEYESVRKEYQQKVADKMGREQWMEYNGVQRGRVSVSLRWKMSDV